MHPLAEAPAIGKLDEYGFRSLPGTNPGRTRRRDTDTGRARRPAVREIRHHDRLYDVAGDARGFPTASTTPSGERRRLKRAIPVL